MPGYNSKLKIWVQQFVARNANSDASNPNPTPRPFGARPSPWQGRVKIVAAQPLFPARTRPHIGHCQGMVEAWVGSFSVLGPGICQIPDAKPSDDVPVAPSGLPG